MMRRIMPVTALLTLAACDGASEIAQPEPGASSAQDMAASPRKAASPEPEETRPAPVRESTPMPVASESGLAGPAPTPSAEPTLYTLPNVPADDVAFNRAALTAIPARYLGEWDFVEGNCAPQSDLRMVVRPGRIGFYESSGKVTAVRRTRQGLLVSLAMEGEGERWEEDYALRLVSGRERLAVTSASQPDRTAMRKRCPASHGPVAP